MKEKGFNKDKQLKISISVQYRKGTKLFNNSSTFVPPYYTLSLARNIIAYTSIQGTNREKYFNLIIYEGKMPTLAGNNHLSVHFLLHGLRLFHLPTEKVLVQSVKNEPQGG